jgi:N-carbamoylputrescine amidase
MGGQNGLIEVLMVAAICLALPIAARTPQAAAAGDQKPQCFTVALMQMQPTGNDQAANQAKADRFCRQAAALGADLALMPEMWSIGYTRFDPDKPGDREAFWDQAVSKESSFVQHFARLAVEVDMAIAVTYAQQWDPMPRNVVTVFDRHGTELFTYAKVHTSDFKPLETSMTPGDAFYVGTLDTKEGPVALGAMICFDREQPESARILMLEGAEILVTPNACGLDDRRIQQFRIRAWENAVGVAMANYPAPNQNGHSVAFDASGDLLVEAGEAEGLYMAVFDMDEIRARRSKTIHGNAFRRPHRYGKLVEPAQEAVWRRTDGYGKPWQMQKR